MIAGVVVVNFLLIRLAPGDPAQILMGDFPAPPGTLEAIRHQYGLDQPLYIQLLRYLGEVAQGHLGYSFANRQPVTSLIIDRLGATLLLTVTALFVASVVGVALGIVAARRQGSRLDAVVQIVSLSGYSVPEFWLGQMLILVFAVWLGWLPAQGSGSLRNVAPPGVRFLATRTGPVAACVVLAVLLLAICAPLIAGDPFDGGNDSLLGPATSDQVAEALRIHGRASGAGAEAVRLLGMVELPDAAGLALFRAPAHPYTQGLVRSTLATEADVRALFGIPGRVPPPIAMPTGCRFHPRCPLALPDPCISQRPALMPRGGDREDAQNLMRVFPGRGGGVFARRTLHRAVDGVSLSIFPGETVALVGESGSGKSTIGRMLLGLDRPDEGAVLYQGQDVATLDRHASKRFRRKVQVVFQDSGASLNPRRSIASSIGVSLRYNLGLSQHAARPRIDALLDRAPRATS
eukprot:gene5803-5866_t